jgi:hypothetical protein
MQIEIDPEQEFHVVIGGVAMALSLDALADAYQADSISDETLIWQVGLDEWMRLDTLLATLGAQEEPSSAMEAVGGENSYSVMVGHEDIRTMSLEGLAEAHRAGFVNEGTPVWKVGTSDWVPLSVIIAGCATGEHVSVAPSRPSQPAVHQSSVAPVGAAYRAPAPSAAPSLSPQYSASMHAPPPSSGLAAAPVSAAPSGFAPASLPSAPSSLAPTAASIAPMSPSVGFSGSADLLLDDLEYPAPTGSPWIKRSLLGLSSLAAVFVIYQASSGSVSDEASQLDGVAAQAMVAAAVVEEEKAEPSAWETEKAMMEKARLADEAVAKNGSGSTADAFGARLSGEPEPKKAAPARSKSKWQPKAKKTTGSKNSQYDPMNGSL